MTLRPDDYDKNGDIIPDSVKEDKGDLISRSALKEEYALLMWREHNPYDTVKVCDIVNQTLDFIDNAPTVLFPLTVEINDNVTDEDIETLKRLMTDYKPKVLNLETERPQGDLISREALKKAINDNGCRHSFYFDIFDVIDDAPPASDYSVEIAQKCIELGRSIGKTESKIENKRQQGKWIPVSERLPEERINPYTKDFDEVLCTTDWGEVLALKFGTQIGRAHV